MKFGMMGYAGIRMIVFGMMGDGGPDVKDREHKIPAPSICGGMLDAIRTGS